MEQILLEAYNCSLCKNSGEKLDELLGIQVECDCITTRRKIVANRSLFDKAKEDGNALTSVIKENNKVMELPKLSVKEEVAGLVAAKKTLIPQSRINDDFNLDYLEKRVNTLYKVNGYTIQGFEYYEKMLSTIVENIREGKKLKSSFILSAPNGLGKSTFANTCIKLLDMNGFSVTPIISLLDLFELHTIHMNKLRNTALEYVSLSNSLEQAYGEEKSVTDNKDYVNNLDLDSIANRYTYRDYVNADVIFVMLTMPGMKRLEIEELRNMLAVRSRFMRPTVVITDLTLNAYTYEKKDRGLFWDRHLNKTGVIKDATDILNIIECKAWKNEAE